MIEKTMEEEENKMSDLEKNIIDKIVQYVLEFGLCDTEEVTGEIAQTNHIFTEEHVEDVNLKKLDDSKYSFTCHVIMSGEPRKEDVMFCGDTINVIVNGNISLDKETNEWKIDDELSITAEVEDWGEDLDPEDVSP